MLRWRLEMVDTWFFREARSHDAVGVGQLYSDFPPPIGTLYGAIRTCLGDCLGVSWDTFAQEQAEHYALLGDGERLGAVQIAAVQLARGDEVLYPAPADLLKKAHADGSGFAVMRLTVGAPVLCDLGYVALPELPAGAPPGCKPLAPAWVTATGLQRWLAGAVPTQAEVVTLADLIASEPRIGIARDVRRASVKEGLLYQTLHLRPKQTFYVDVYVQGVPEALAAQLPKQTSVRLGGEGRCAAVTIEPVAALPVPELSPPVSAVRGLAVLLATPGDLRTVDSADTEGVPWCLPGFHACTDAAGLVSHWSGQVAGIALNLHSCVQDRPLRRGGWDMRQRQSKALGSFAAPGTVFYVTPTSSAQDMSAAAQALHGYRLSANSLHAPGLLLAGWWMA
ncbi:type III-B CRISPR module-associated Cmr3 family protein [Thiorhodospira sibirica]|uniref:type III-B CRISPR module-associated Cmr3 family protein n=1 Tax=Thiorhodospira sibirica TaxID=154347 RepID=UPI00022C5883|nr:type III-B CRISPR module-associated Cmr3 family protein [Thiorhodospira sibirica]